MIMKNLLKLFIVAAFSIISLPLLAQVDKITGNGKVTLVSANLLTIKDAQTGLTFTTEKPKGPFFTLEPGDVISYKIILLPNGEGIYIKLIFKD